MSFQEKMRDVKRFENILELFLKYELGHLIRILNLTQLLSFHKRIKITKHPEGNEAVKLRKVFEELGGAFIKLGQFLSLRPDLVSSEVADEFKKFQDDLPSFSFEEVHQIIESEFKKPIDQVFSKFNSKPIASASIGQVHEAKLIDGTKVAIKVQRPGISEIFKADIHIMRFFANYLEKNNEKAKKLKVTAIVDEFERYTEKELNYMDEARNIGMFHDFFKNDKSVKVPKVYFDLTTSKVLVMEFIDGKKITEDTKLDRNKVSKTLTTFFLKQFFFLKNFHADPHPGNIFLLKDGKLCLLDYGIVGRLGGSLGDKVKILIIAMVNGDTEKVANAFINMGILEDDVDIESFRLDLSDALWPYYNVELKRIKIGESLKTFLGVAFKYNMLLPKDFVLLAKSIITLEGFCIDLYPDFNFVQVVKPFAETAEREELVTGKALNKVYKQISDLKESLIKIPEQVSTLLSKVNKGKIKLEIAKSEIDEIVEELESGTSRRILGVLTAAIFLGSIIVLQIDVGSEIYGIPALSFIGFILTIILCIYLIYRTRRERMLLFKK